jgi:hypothetical protein
MLKKPSIPLPNQTFYSYIYTLIHILYKYMLKKLFKYIFKIQNIYTLMDAIYEYEES